MNILFIASFAVIAPDPPKSRALSQPGRME
jgi:hypothetical protein